MANPQERQKNRNAQKGEPGGGSGSKTQTGQPGGYKLPGEAQQGTSDQGAKGSQAKREAERRGQNAPGGGKRPSEGAGWQRGDESHL